jgi:[histone H4]-lysine20 N-methyltransferase SETD8
MQWVVEYKGILLTKKEADMKAKDYSTNLEMDSAMYYFKSKDKFYCIDATIETSNKGRLINHHCKKPNLKARVFFHKDKPTLPRIVFVAIHDIKVGTELLYDHGESSHEVIKELRTTTEITCKSKEKAATSVEMSDKVTAEAEKISDTTCIMPSITSKQFHSKVDINSTAKSPNLSSTSISNTYEVWDHIASQELANVSTEMMNVTHQTSIQRGIFMAAICIKDFYYISFINF